MSNRPLVGDVALTVAAIALPAALVVAGIVGPIRVFLGGVLLLFLPGYALTTLAFPSAERISGRSEDSPQEHGPRRAGLPFLERLAVGFGLSVALVPIFAWALNTAFAADPLAAYDLTSILGASVATALVATLLGAVRRLRTPASERYVLPLGELRTLRAGWDVSNTDRALNVALTFAIVVAAVVVTAGVVAPSDGEEFTQVSLLTADENGTLVAENFPQQISPGESAEMVLEVENYEGETVSYTVVVQLQRVDESGAVVERAELSQFSQTLKDRQTWQATHTVRPTFEGEDLRIAYLVYQGEAPADPTLDSAYRSVTLWTDVTDSPTDNSEETQ